LIERGVLKIQAFLNTEKFYSVSATIGIDADPATISKLIKKFQDCPLVYNLVKVTGGHHNLIVDLIAPNQRRIVDLIEKQIRSEPKIRYLEVDIGELPIVPKVHSLPNFVDKTKKCPCETKCSECEYFL
jgi:DNA-binding Lrp family transcriptional regulator